MTDLGSRPLLLQEYCCAESSQRKPYVLQDNNPEQKDEHLSFMASYATFSANPNPEVKPRVGLVKRCLAQVNSLEKSSRHHEQQKKRQRSS
jgi:hypothetical protein